MQIFTRRAQNLRQSTGQPSMSPARGAFAAGWENALQRLSAQPSRGAAMRAAARRSRSVAQELDTDERGENRLRRLEAVLFLAKEPLNSRKLAKLANLTDGAEARRLVRRLMTQLDDARCAFQVAEVGGGFCLMTRPAFDPWLARLRGASPDMRLSTPAMETLAIVAYRQPVLRTDVEAIRGVGCNEILRQLMERELLRIVGRSDELGRPFLYGTTKQFLRDFGLRSLDELPPLPENGTQAGATTHAARGLAVASITQPQEKEMTSSVTESIESEIDPTQATDIGAPIGVVEIEPRAEEYDADIEMDADPKLEADAEHRAPHGAGMFASDDDDEYEYEYEYEEVDDDDEEYEDADDDGDDDDEEYEYEYVDDEDEEEDEEDDDDSEWVEVDDDEIPDEDFEYEDEVVDDDDDWDDDDDYGDDFDDDVADFEDDD